MSTTIEPPQPPSWAANPNYAIGVDLVRTTVAACRTVVCDGKV